MGVLDAQRRHQVEMLARREHEVHIPHVLLPFGSASQIEKAGVAFLAAYKIGIIYGVVVRPVNPASGDVRVQFRERAAESQQSLVIEVRGGECMDVVRVRVDAVSLGDKPIDARVGASHGGAGFSGSAPYVQRIVLVLEIERSTDAEIGLADGMFGVELENVAMLVNVVKGGDDRPCPQAAGQSGVAPNG